LSSRPERADAPGPECDPDLSSRPKRADAFSSAFASVRTRRLAQWRDLGKTLHTSQTTVTCTRLTTTTANQNINTRLPATLPFPSHLCAKLALHSRSSLFATARSWSFGLCATRSREPRQARKGATVSGSPRVPQITRGSLNGQPAKIGERDKLKSEFPRTSSNTNGLSSHSPQVATSNFS
jgi:hypothetical protein